MSFIDNLTIQDCINYMKTQIRQQEKYPANYKYNTPYYRKTVEYLEQAKDRPKGEWKRGRWEPWGALGEQFYNCSVCNHEISAWRYNFCPNCGADMREER